MAGPTDDVLAALLDHLVARPEAPVPEHLRVDLIATLRRSRRGRAVALRALRVHLDPKHSLSRWQAAGRLLEVLQGYDRLGRIARGQRVPANPTERLCADLARCGPLPTTQRGIWNLLEDLNDGFQKSRAELAAGPLESPP